MAVVRFAPDGLIFTEDITALSAVDVGTVRVLLPLRMYAVAVAVAKTCDQGLRYENLFPGH